MNRQTKRIVIGIIAVVCLIVALRRWPNRPAEAESGLRPVMGTFARVVAVAQNRKTADQSIEAALAEMYKVDDLMSDYKKDSEISQVNRDAFKQPVKVSQSTFEVLDKAVEFSKLSGGSFDVTVGPIVQLWRAATESNSVPTEDQLQQARSKVGYEKLTLDANELTVRFAVDGMMLDLGGIAKGYAIDKAVEAMQKQGALGGMVDIGGDIRCFGRPSKGKTHWLIGVQDPTKAKEGLDPGTSLLVLQLEDAAIATSGDYRRFALVEGQRYSHIISRTTAAGARGLSSVTIIAKKAIDADALATAVTVLGSEKGLALVENLPEIEAILMASLPEPQFIITGGAAKYVK
jgi:thiamine biosynthesis lipoprotein